MPTILPPIRTHPGSESVNRSPSPTPEPDNGEAPHNTVPSSQPASPSDIKQPSDQNNDAPQNPVVVTSQPTDRQQPSDSQNDVNQNPAAVTSQPTSSATTHKQQQQQQQDDISYVDSDTHAAQFYCGLMRCCQACCASGEDKRCYYPWDKGPLCCLPLGCGWCLVGLLFPCSLCIPSCRNIICMVQEGAWDGTCFGACICGIPRSGGTGRQRSNSEDSELD